MEQDNLENSVEILQPSGDFKLGRQAGAGFCFRTTYQSVRSN